MTPTEEKALTVYKASAGSGKTFTLSVEYIKLLIKNPMSFRSTLAVTFTNKATEEMKTRILSQLYGIWKQLPKSKDYIEKIKSELGVTEQFMSDRAKIALFNIVHNYSYFRIETIDSFFQSVLRNLARELDLTANPTYLGNNNTYWSAEMQLATYRKAWRGAIIAGELHTRQSTGQVPWPMLSDVGSSNRMRGYYEGRYRDKNVIDAQLELRQHIWHRNGIALWVGAAEVFPRYSELRLSRILPNAGVGYRWQFKKGVNVRLDYGFSRNGTGFIFNINEAF